MTRPARKRPDDRAVIQISRQLHGRMAKIKNEREQELGRLVTFTEIIDGWRVRAEGLDVLAAHVQLRGVSDGT